MAKKEKLDYDFLKEQVDGSGFEDMNQDTMAIPFIRVVQALSPQKKKSKAEYIPNCEDGDIINTITKRIYEQPLRFIVGKFERYYIEWKPNRGGFVQALSPEIVETNTDRYQMVPNNKGGMKLADVVSGNDVVETYVYYIVLPDYPEDSVCIMSLYSSQLKEAKKLNRIMNTTFIPGTGDKAAPFFLVFTLTTVEMSKDDHDWMGVRFDFESLVTREQLDYVVGERK